MPGSKESQLRRDKPARISESLIDWERMSSVESKTSCPKQPQCLRAVGPPGTWLNDPLLSSRCVQLDEYLNQVHLVPTKFELRSNFPLPFAGIGWPSDSGRKGRVRGQRSPETRSLGSLRSFATLLAPAGKTVNGVMFSFQQSQGWHSRLSVSRPSA